MEARWGSHFEWHVEDANAVAREHLDVTTAFGMHYDALPWSTIVASAAPPASP